MSKKKYENLITEIDDKMLSAQGPESFSGTDHGGPTRRTFFRELTAGAVGMAFAGALSQLGFPATSTAKDEKNQLEGLRVANTPPWPKGTTGNRYDHLFCTRLKEKAPIDAVASPMVGLRGASDIPGAGINMGFAMYVKPIRLELESHHHDVDEYLFFLGAQLPDLTANFGAEIEMFIGEEYERHIITKPTVLYIPRGLEHNPMDIKRLDKPMLFCPVHLAPYFNGVYKTGYMQYLGSERIDYRYASSLKDIQISPGMEDQ